MCRSCSTPWPVTTAARPSPTPVGRSRGGGGEPPPHRCDGCVSTAPVPPRFRSTSRVPTCGRCSAVRRSRARASRPSPPSTSPPVASCVRPPTGCRCAGPAPSRMPSTTGRGRCAMPSTVPCSAPPSEPDARRGGCSSTPCSGRSGWSPWRGWPGWPCSGASAWPSCLAPTRRHSASCPCRWSCSSAGCCSVSVSAPCAGGGRGRGARHRRAVIAKRLASSIATVGDDLVAAPVAAVLGRHRQTRRQLDLARS